MCTFILYFSNAFETFSETPGQQIQIVFRNRDTNFKWRSNFWVMKYNRQDVCNLSGIISHEMIQRMNFKLDFIGKRTSGHFLDATNQQGSIKYCILFFFFHGSANLRQNTVNLSVFAGGAVESSSSTSPSRILQ